MQERPTGQEGTVWFKTASPFEYFNDPEKTREARSRDGSMSTVGDVRYVDAEGYLYLTDRRTFMIISGGVNIYPQECENLLITHPTIADAAVFGVPNPDLGALSGGPGMTEITAYATSTTASAPRPNSSSAMFPATRLQAAIRLAQAKACSERPSALISKGPAIWPAPKAAVITPTASDAGAPPSRNASLMPAMVITTKVPPTQTAEINSVGTLTQIAGASTPAASTHFDRTHNCRGGRSRNSQALKTVDSAAAAPNTGQT